MGSGSFGFFANTNTEYKIEITSSSGVGGNWTVNPTNGSVSTGQHTIAYTFQGTNVDVSGLTPGTHTIAQVKWYTRPQ
jgi:hypothetical protein